MHPKVLQEQQTQVQPNTGQDVKLEIGPNGNGRRAMGGKMLVFAGDGQIETK
jgi:hypothetical protein